MLNSLGWFLVDYFLYEGKQALYAFFRRNVPVLAWGKISQQKTQKGGNAGKAGDFLFYCNG
jgi:hypothetical protein